MSRTLSPPSATDTILDRLFDERIVYLAGAVDDEAAHRITAQLLLLATDDPVCARLRSQLIERLGRGPFYYLQARDAAESAALIRSACGA